MIDRLLYAITEFLGSDNFTLKGQYPNITVLLGDSEIEHPLSEFGIVDPDQLPEPRIVPEVVEGWQAEVAMKISKVDPSDPNSPSVWERLQDLISSMEDLTQKLIIQTVLAKGKIRRDSQLLGTMAALIPLSQERIEDLLILANSIEA